MHYVPTKFCMRLPVFLFWYVSIVFNMLKMLYPGNLYMALKWHRCQFTSTIVNRDASINKELKLITIYWIRKFVQLSLQLTLKSIRCYNFSSRYFLFLTVLTPTKKKCEWIFTFLSSIFHILLFCCFQCFMYEKRVLLFQLCDK